MNRSRIGGALDYRKLAELHKPTDSDVLRAAAVELRGRGLTEHDIGRALNLNPDAVRRLLTPTNTTPKDPP